MSKPLSQNHFDLYEPEVPNPSFKEDKSVPLKWVDVSDLSGHGELATLSPCAQYNDKGQVLCYTTVEGVLMPEFRKQDRMPEEQQKGIEGRINEVLDGETGDDILFRAGDREAVATALDYITPRSARGDYPGEDTAHKVFATIHTSEEDTYGKPLRVLGFRNADKIRIGEEGYLRLAKAFRTIRPFQPGRLAKALYGEEEEANHYKEDGAAYPGVEDEITADTLNTDPLLFEAHTTDAMTVVKFNPENEHWEIMVLPNGEMGESPWICKDHYAGGFITGIPCYKGKNGRLYAFRLNDHIDRAVRDAKSIGMKNVHPDMLKAALGAQLEADARWVPDAGNEAGNRYYLRAVGNPTNLSPKLAGGQKELRALGTPVGPYKDKEMLKVAFMARSRPVSDQSAQNKSTLNYTYAVKAAGTWQPKKFGYDEYVYVDNGRIQEGLAANIIVIKYGAGEGGKDLMLIPTREHGDVLPSVTSMAVEELAEKYHDMEVRTTRVTKNDLLTSDEILMTGTAMNVRGIRDIKYSGKRNENGVMIEEGPSMFEDRGPEMGRVGKALKKDLDAIMSMTHEIPELNEWMVEIA